MEENLGQELTADEELTLAACYRIALARAKQVRAGRQGNSEGAPASRDGLEMEPSGSFSTELMSPGGDQVTHSSISNG